MNGWAGRLQGSIVAALLCVMSPVSVLAQTPPSPVARENPPPAEITPAPEAPAAPSADFSAYAPFIDGYVSNAMRSNHIAGVGVAVVRGGQVVFKKGYGLADAKGRPVNPDRTLFRIASISKTFTWIGLMQLVEAGDVDLDQPANRYLPTALHIPAQEFAKPVLVRHLMSHTAGFEDRFAGHLFIDDPSAAVPLVDALARYRPRRVRPPGVAAVYSNYGVALAGAIIQHVSGLAFEDYVEQRILTPLALQNTTFREPYAPALVQGRGLPSPMTPALAADVSDGFRWVGGAYVRQPFEHVMQLAPAGSVSATTADMARYMLVLKGDAPGVLRPQTAALFGREAPLFANARGVAGVSWGMLQDKSPGGWRAWGHDGDTLHFHSKLAIYPELDLGVFVTTNTDAGWSLRNTLGHAIADRVGGPRPEPKAANAAPVRVDLERFTGAYLSDRHAYTTAERIFCLVGCTIDISVSNDKRLIAAGGGAVARLAPLGLVKDKSGRLIHRFRDLETGKTAAFLEERGRILHYYDASGVGRATRISTFASPQGFLSVVLIGMLAAAGAFAAGVARVFGPSQKSARARLAGLALPAAGFAWVVAFVMIGSYLGAVASDNWILFSVWPGGLRGGVLAATAAAVLTFIAAITIVFAWRPAEWSVWRRARILVTLAAMAALAATLHAWNLIGPRL